MFKIYVLRVECDEEHYAQLEHDDIIQLIHNYVIHNDDSNKLLYEETSYWPSCTKRCGDEEYDDCYCEDQVGKKTIETGTFSTEQDAKEAIRVIESLNDNDDSRPMNVIYAVFATEVDSGSYRCCLGEYTELEKYPVESFDILTKREKSQRAKWNNEFLNLVGDDKIPYFKNSVCDLFDCSDAISSIGTTHDLPHSKICIMIKTNLDDVKDAIRDKCFEAIPNNPRENWIFITLSENRQPLILTSNPDIDETETKQQISC